MSQSETLTNPTFTCIICTEYPKYPKEAVNCRYCTNFFCTHCIDKWFRTNSYKKDVTCPTCRQIVKRDDFIKLVWLEDHLKWLNDTMKINKCYEHSKEALSIYCITCTKAICAQCILPMFNGKHIDHNYERIDAAQQRLLKSLEQKQKEVTSNLNQFDKSIQNKKLLIDEILTRKKEQLDELEQFQINIKKQIESETSKEQKKYQDQLELLRKQRMDYESKFITLRKEIESFNQVELFKRENSIHQKVLEQPNISLFDQNHLTDQSIKNPLTLPWETRRISITEFSNHSEKNRQIRDLEILQNYDQNWLITIYPNGKGYQQGHYLCIEIELNKGMAQSINYNIIIELIHHTHDDNKHNYIFKTIQSFKQGQTIIYDQFYKLNHLLIDGLINSNTDSMEFRFKVRPNSIFDERKLLQWQIESFRENKQNNDKLNKDNIQLKEQLNSLQREYKQENQLIEKQKIKIQILEKDNCELKRKRTQTNDHYHKDQSTNREDRRVDPDQRRTVVFAQEKRFKN